MGAEDFKVGSSCIHRGRFGTIDFLLPNGWAIVDFGYAVEEVPLTALEEPDRESDGAPPPEVEWRPEAEELPVTDRTEYKRALRAEVGPPFKCGYSGCLEDRGTKLKRSAHEREAHGKALKAGERPGDDQPTEGGGDEDGISPD